MSIHPQSQTNWQRRSFAKTVFRVPSDCCSSTGYSQQHTKTCTYTVVYKYLITLSIKQCSRERSFSKLKILKTRLRSALTQDNLEALMLIALKKDIELQLNNIKERIIDRFALTSKEFSSLLLLRVDGMETRTL